MKTYRVGIIGFGHMHVNNVAALYAKHPQVVMAACADTVPAKPELRTAPYTRDWNKEYALTELGVAKERLYIVGHGPTVPVDTDPGHIVTPSAKIDRGLVFPPVPSRCRLAAVRP